MNGPNQSPGWIKLMRSEETRELSSDAAALGLLAIIALRARWRAAFNIHGLKMGEALIGDYDSMGLTRREYRTRLDRLKNWGFVTTRATNRGTVVTITNTDVFDVFGSSDGQQDGQTEARQRPTNGQPATTNEEGKESKNEKKEKISRARATREECQAFAQELGLPDSDGDSFFDGKEGNGWKNGSNAIRDWRATMRNWKANGWHPSQKAAAGSRSSPSSERSAIKDYLKPGNQSGEYTPKAAAELHVTHF